ncbi:hypothetical protein ACHHYP_13601 [Achlya hypogyna]|uniref:Uncharacterized protein n=1 Tax=Achlya hypogyna TaxID=1202772 RepID=A0A1V9ZFM9_ACHHY|nr:hypothetical protein ACHHYP_13601 [Achlya hypogyna]
MPDAHELTLDFDGSTDVALHATYDPWKDEIAVLAPMQLLRHKLRRGTKTMWREAHTHDNLADCSVLYASGGHVLLQRGDIVILYDMQTGSSTTAAIPSEMARQFTIGAVGSKDGPVMLVALGKLVFWQHQQQDAWVEVATTSDVDAAIWAAHTQSRLLGSLFVAGHVSTRPSDDGVILRFTTIFSEECSRIVASKNCEHHVADVPRDCNLSSPAFHAPSQRLTVVLNCSIVVFYSASTHAFCVYRDAAKVLAHAWHPRLPHAALLAAGGVVHWIDARSGQPFHKLAIQVPATQHLRIALFDAAMAKLLVFTPDRLSLWSIPSPTVVPLAASSATASTERHQSVEGDMLGQPVTTEALMDRTTQFLHTPHTDVAATLDAVADLGTLSVVLRKESVLVKLVAVAAHALHPQVPLSIRPLVFFIFHQVTRAPRPLVARLTNLLRDAPQNDHWFPAYAGAFQRLREARSPREPYAPKLQRFFAKLSVPALSLAALRDYNVAKLFQLAEVAWLRQSEDDVAFLKLWALVMALHFLGLEPHMPVDARSVALSLWWELPSTPQWSELAALELAAKFDDVSRLLVKLAVTFATPRSEEFVRQLCHLRPTLHHAASQSYLATILNVYRTLPILTDLRRVVGADLTTLPLSSPFLSAFLDTATTAEPSVREATAIKTVVKRLWAVRWHLSAAGLPNLFAALGAGRTITPVARLMRPPTPLWGLRNSAANGSSAVVTVLARTVAYVVWAATLRDAMSISLATKHPEGAWFAARLGPASAVFGTPAGDVRKEQLQCLHESLRWSTTPLETAHALAFLRVVAPVPSRLSKREQRLVVDINLRIGSNYVETKQAWIQRHGDVSGALGVQCDPLFWAVCRLLQLDSSPEGVVVIDDIAPPVYSDTISRLEVLELFHAQDTAVSRQVVALAERVVDHQTRTVRPDVMSQATVTDAVDQATVASQVRRLPSRALLTLPTPAAPPVKPSNSSAEPRAMSAKQSSQNVLKLLQLQKARVRDVAPSAARPLERANTMAPAAAAVSPQVKPLVFPGADPASVQLKLLRKAVSMQNVPLRHKSYLPPPTRTVVLGTRPATDASLITDAASQTTAAETVAPTPAMPVVQHDSCTNTPPVVATIEATQTDDSPVPVATHAAPAFPVFVQIKKRGAPYMHVMDIDIAEAARGPRLGENTATSAASDGSQTTNPTPLAMKPLATIHDESEVTKEKSPTPQELVPGEEEVIVPPPPVEDPLPATAPLGLSRFSSMKQQLEDMRRRLLDIEKFADAIDSDFVASHEMMNRIEARRRAMTPKEFSKQLQALEATHETLAASLQATKAKVTGTPAPPRTSALAREAADNVSDAKKLLAKLEATLATPSAT